MTTTNRKRAFTLLFTLLLLSQSSGFVTVVRPTTTQAPIATTTVFSTHLNRNPDKPNFLKHVSNKISSWLRPIFSKSPLHHEDKTTVDLLKKQQTKNNDDGEWLFPLGSSLEKVVNRELTAEKRKAKPLLHQAQVLIQKDPDVIAALGQPIVIGSMVSQQKSTTVINHKKSQQIWDSFQVAGPRDRGVATIVADSYAKGHLKSLRVTIGGIKYDIDV